MMELYKKYREMISYAFWGAATTGVSWISYTLFAGYIDMSIAVANVLSWICAILFAFVVNKMWVFQSKKWCASVLVREFCLFISARLATGVIEIVMVPLLVNVGLNQSIFGVKGALSKILVSVVVILLNYVFSKFFVFKSVEKDCEE